MTKKLAERARVTADARAFFAGRGFLEVETPILVPSPGLDLHLDAFQVAPPDKVSTRQDALRYLSTSPEYQMKRLLADGFPRIFQLSKAFRREELGGRHNPEFTILEWYRANAGIDAIMQDTEQLVARVTGGRVEVSGRRINTLPPFARMTVCEAFAAFAKTSTVETLAIAEANEDRFFRILVDAVEPALARLDHAVLLTEYPAPQASLARKKPGDPRVAERFELYVAGVELCNGFGELVDVAEQRARLERDQEERKSRGLPVYPLDERFLEALARVPPSGGNALGVDRLAALACGTSEIAEIMAFTASEL